MANSPDKDTIAGNPCGGPKNGPDLGDAPCEVAHVSQ
jgi:hypothetical protein